MLVIKLDASADKNAQNKFARYATVVLKAIDGGILEIRWTRMVYKGYPGGCAVPSSHDSATSSPLSPPGMDGIRVFQ